MHLFVAGHADTRLLGQEAGQGTGAAFLGADYHEVQGAVHGEYLTLRCPIGTTA